MPCHKRTITSETVILYVLSLLHVGFYDRLPTTSTNMSVDTVGSQSSGRMRIYAALFYGISSFCIVIVNKIVLTSFGYVTF